VELDKNVGDEVDVYVNVNGIARLEIRVICPFRCKLLFGYLNEVGHNPIDLKMDCKYRKPQARDKGWR
jgi:hypothetical protein